MSEGIPFEYKLEIDSLAHELLLYNNGFSYTKIYNANIGETLSQLLDNLKGYKFSNVLICNAKVKTFLDAWKKAIRNKPDERSYKEDIDILQNKMNRVKTLCDMLVEKGFNNYEEQEIKLTEREKLKIQKKNAEKRLNEIQECNAPYLNFSVGVSLVLVSIIFMCIPTFFNVVALYHICGAMMVLGVFLLLKEITVRQTLGWYGYSDKITSKKAFTFLLQAFVYMIPLSVLYYFFAHILVIRILFFIQVWFCLVLVINGIFLLITTNLTKEKEKRFNIWNFVLGIITIIGFVIQVLQIFKVI